MNQSRENNSETRLTFRKVDTNTQQGLPDAEFALYQDDNLCRTARSDSTGLVTFRCLAPGFYILREFSPPPGYAANSTRWSICVSGPGRVYVNGCRCDHFIICNVPQTALGSFTAIKVNAADLSPLGGAVFELFVGEVSMGSVITEPSGEVSFSGLAPGEYILEETQAPPGFQTLRRTYAVLVAPDGSVTIDGKPAQGFLLGNVFSANMAFQKVDAVTQLPVMGAVFQLFPGQEPMESEPVATATSGEDGMLRFDNIGMGNYSLREQMPAPGYLPNTAVYNVVVANDGSIQIDGIPDFEFILPNREFPDVRVFKTDEAGAPLVGAGFELRQDETTIMTATSDETGFALFPRLAPGVYSLRETDPPEGFRPYTPIHIVVVQNDGVITIDGSPITVFSIPNQRETIRVSGIKIWNDSNNATNIRPDEITVTLFQNGMAHSSQQVATAVNSFTFSDLPELDAEGTPFVYTVDEESVPVGYEKRVEDTTIINDILVFCIFVVYFDATNNVPLFDQYFAALYGSDYTVYAIDFPGYEAIPPLSHTFTNITRPQEHTFYYNAI